MRGWCRKLCSAALIPLGLSRKERLRRGTALYLGGNGARTPVVPAEASMEKQVSISQVSISDWVAGLAAIPERDFTLQNVQEYIIAHAVKPETLDQYLFFSKGSYTRNLIFKNDIFERS